MLETRAKVARTLCSWLKTQHALMLRTWRSGTGIVKAVCPDAAHHLCLVPMREHGPPAQSLALEASSDAERFQTLMQKALRHKTGNHHHRLPGHPVVSGTGDRCSSHLRKPFVEHVQIGASPVIKRSLCSPGDNTVTLTPLPSSSRASPLEKERTYTPW
jgi:hypothetical protein